MEFFYNLTTALGLVGITGIVLIALFVGAFKEVRAKHHALRATHHAPHPAFLAAFALGAVNLGAEKPDHPPQPPTPVASSVDVTVDASFAALTITPTVPAELIDVLAGQRYYVQIKRDDGAWETIHSASGWTGEPITVNDCFISGGRGTVRRLRIYWPDAQISDESEVAE